MDVVEMIVATKIMINKKPYDLEDETGDPSDTVILHFLEMAWAEIYNRFAAQFPTRFTTTADGTYAAGALQATLPTLVQRRQLVSVFSYLADISTAMPMACRNIAEMPNMSGLSGVPRAYMVEGPRIYLRPIPVVTTNLRYVYVPAPPSVELAPDIGFPVELQYVICNLAASKIAARNMDETAAGLESIAKDGMNQIHDAMRAMVGDDGYVISAPPGPFETY